MIENINQVIDKFIPLGAVRAEIMYYGMPSWWHNGLNTSWEGILIASAYLSERYNVDLESLLSADKLDPNHNLDMALLDNARFLIESASERIPRYVFFRPTQSIIGLVTKKTIVSPVPLGFGVDYNTFAPWVNWSELRSEDVVFLERVLSL